MIFSVILMFLYVFAFPIASVKYFDSAIVVFFFLFFLMIIDKRVRRQAKTIILSKSILKVFFLWLLVIAYSVLIPIFLKTTDFSIIKTFIHQILSLITGLLLIAYLNNKNVSIIDVIVYAFVAQAVIQLLSFVFEPIKEVLNLFRSQSTIDIQMKYSGIRGLGVSGYAVFGLAVAYGLMFIMWAVEWKRTLTKVSIFLKMILISILLFGAMSAGRTALVGFAIAVVIRVVMLIKENYVSLKSITGFVCFCFCAIFVLIVISRLGVSESVHNLFRYVNEFLANLINGKGFTSSSTDKLWDMYFRVDPNYLMFGCGKYTDVDGSYYMKTDAGYMRNILFFGVFGFILLLVYQCAFLNFRGKKNTLKSLVYLLFLLLMHIKGEVVGFLIITQSMLLLLNFSKYSEVQCESESVVHNVEFQYKTGLFERVNW